MKNIFILCAALLLWASCNKKNANSPNYAAPQKLLVLKVDYQTNAFKGAHIFSFTHTDTTFTLENEFDWPIDNGYVKINYREFNTTVFDASLMWMGTGEIHYPQLSPASQFNYLPVSDTVYPISGFADVCNPYQHTYDYTPAWFAIQKLDVVRSFLQQHPSEQVKMFLYRPSAGGTEPDGWSWIFFLKG